jgi:hypothetical protein
MKVFIGPYVHYIGPYQIAEKLLFWCNKYDPKVKSLGNKLKQSLFLKFICDWIYKKRTRKIKIEFQSYDFYSLDHTLALIILPALQEMKEFGNFFVVDEDIPKNILDKWSHLEENKRNNFKYQWIMNELIWTFEQIVNDQVLNKEEELRINNGLILFGKYFKRLWT